MKKILKKPTKAQVKKVVIKTAFYILYYLLIMFVGYSLNVDLKTIVFMFLVLWTYPFEIMFEKFINKSVLNQVNRNLIEASVKYTVASRMMNNYLYHDDDPIEYNDRH